MSEDDDFKKFSEQYIKSCKEQISALASNPQMLEKALEPFMKMQQEYLNNPENANLLAGVTNSMSSNNDNNDEDTLNVILQKMSHRLQVIRKKVLPKIMESIERIDSRLMESIERIDSRLMESIERIDSRLENIENHFRSKSDSKSEDNSNNTYDEDN